MKTAPSFLILLFCWKPSLAFVTRQASRHVASNPCTTSTSQLPAVVDDAPEDGVLADTSRRRMLLATTFAVAVPSLFPIAALAATREPLNDLLYRILRVREATQQETRLIKSGKFKDMQRANVKLAVRFMIDNYRLNDAFVGASSYLDGNNKRIEAGQIGQSTVQNLYTILEYFDSSDVENIKVGSNSMSGKEEIVLRGLDATRRGIDDFLVYFAGNDVQDVQNFINDENRLNEKEFDSALGQIVNLPTKS